MKIQRVHVALLLLLSLAAAALIVRAAKRPREEVVRASPGSDAVTLLLPEAALLATLDIAQLSRSAWGNSALQSLPGLAGSAPGQRCASELLAETRRLAFAIPAESPDTREFDVALVVEGDFQASAAAACASTLIESRGGSPVLATLNDFSVVRDRKSSGELGVRDGGPLVVSGGTYFRELVDRAHRSESVREPLLRERLHEALRRKAGAAPLLATWVLPPGWLERWLGEPEFSASPLARVRAVVIRGRAERELRLQAELSVEDVADAERLEAFMRRLVGELAPGEGARASPFAVQREGAVVALSTSLESSDLSSLLGVLARFGPDGTTRSHPLGRPNPQQVQPQRQGAPGGATQK